MGAAGSTRRITVRNDDPRIIQVTLLEVSEDVVRRLKSSSSAASSEPQVSQDVKEVPESQPQQHQPAPQAPPRQENFVLGMGLDGQTTIETISALEMRKRKEEELQANDIFWREKLRDIEARYIKAEFDSGQEFSKKLTKLSALIPKKGEERCKEASMNVAECYRTNPNETLKCSELVKEFAKCVERGSALS